MDIFNHKYFSYVPFHVAELRAGPNIICFDSARVITESWSALLCMCSGAYEAKGTLKLGRLALHALERE